jgi:hypothetical protein
MIPIYPPPTPQASPCKLQPVCTPMQLTPCFSYLSVHFIGKSETPTTTENQIVQSLPLHDEQLRASEETLKPIIPIPHQLRNLIQQLLQIVIRDLIRQTRNQGLCFFGRITTQAPYTASISISLFLFLFTRTSPQTLGPASLRSKRGEKKERDKPSCALSNFARSLCAESNRSTASTFSFRLKRAKWSR